MPEAAMKDPKVILGVDGPGDLTHAKAFANIMWILTAKPEYTVQADAGVLAMLYASHFCTMHVPYNVEVHHLHALESLGLLSLKWQTLDTVHVLLSDGPDKKYLGKA